MTAIFYSGFWLCALSLVSSCPLIIMLSFLLSYSSRHYVVSSYRDLVVP